MKDNLHVGGGYCPHCLKDTENCTCMQDYSKGIKIETWENVRPDWCPNSNCEFKMSSQNLICTGKLQKPEKHGNDYNTHRFCLDERETGHEIHDLQINKSDAWYIKRHMDKIISGE